MDLSKKFPTYHDTDTGNIWFPAMDTSSYTHVLALYEDLYEIINSTHDEYLQDLVINWSYDYDDRDITMNIHYSTMSIVEKQERELLAKLLEKYPEEK